MSSNYEVVEGFFLQCGGLALFLICTNAHTGVCGEEAGSGGDRGSRPTIAVGEQDDSFPHHRCPSSLVSRS